MALGEGILAEIISGFVVGICRSAAEAGDSHEREAGRILDMRVSEIIGRDRSNQILLQVRREAEAALDREFGSR